jgi:hypothetical protein
MKSLKRGDSCLKVIALNSSALHDPNCMRHLRSPKNAIDHFFPEWRNKAAGYLGYDQNYCHKQESHILLIDELMT